MSIENRVKRLEGMIQPAKTIPEPMYYRLSDLPRETVVKAVRTGLELGIFKLPDDVDITSLTDDQIYDAVVSKGSTE